MDALTTGQLVAVLALGQDNSFGQPLESQLRSTLLAVWLAEAARLVISPKTADSHIQHIYAKIGCSTRGAATLFALGTTRWRPRCRARSGCCGLIVGHSRLLVSRQVLSVFIPDRSPAPSALSFPASQERPGTSAPGEGNQVRLPR